MLDTDWQNDLLKGGDFERAVEVLKEEFDLPGQPHKNKVVMIPLHCGVTWCVARVD